MNYIPRALEKELLLAVKQFPAVILTGPRRAGKTTLLRHLFPKASYFLIEDPDLILRLRSDPRGFIEEIQPPAILDEIQNVPEILNYVRTQIDRFPKRKGLWLITGSQEASLMRGVSESMAGRAAVLNLFPFSMQETPKVSLLKGGYPEVLSSPSRSQVWFRSYVQTYLERDVRAITSIRDLATFRRFLTILATRCGKILNRADLASALGVSVPTISEWLSILEITSQILLIQPFYENFGKRLIKSPKLYFLDSGLACYLLGIETEKNLNQSPFHGPIFEGFVAAEIVKAQLNRGRRKELYFFRDQQGLEVDFLLPAGGQRLILIEAKASRTVTPDTAEPILRLTKNISPFRASGFIIHRSSKEKPFTSVVQPGIRGIPVENLPAIFSPS